MSQYLKQKDKCLRKSCSLHRLVFTRMLKNILWLWFIPWCFYTFLHCTNSWFSLSDDFPSWDAIALRKFSDLFHKSFHLSPCVMLSVFKAVSILSSSACQPCCTAWLHPTLNPVACRLQNTLQRQSVPSCFREKCYTFSVLSNLL